MKNYFLARRDFRSLSVQDLLEARETYHVHLAHLDNVIATAIGLYRIRKDDPDAEQEMSTHTHQRRTNAPPRTLQNTVVRRWSWPCILVFVKQWQTPEELIKQDPDQVVPRFLYMPDGRVVPTCVLLAEQEQQAPPPLQDLSFPDALIGGGYPVITDVQGQPHIGSLGCIVTDGDSTYALTNRHVTGEPGRPIYSLLHNKRQRIGISDSRQTGKKYFQDVYAGWPGTKAFTNLDAGLIRIDDITCWTAQVFGIGEIDDPVDLNVNSISLDLIGCPVRAFGGASGSLTGEIQALFYRYKSIGGIEYISDLLIGPRDEHTPLNTHPGDSGTVWFFDPALSQEEVKENHLTGLRARRYRPLALQWGGHVLLGKQGDIKMNYALATFLSTICRQLDIDIVPDWNTGHREYWGKTGHYKIAAKACELVADPRLKTLLQNNLDAIAFSDDAIEKGQLTTIDAHQFVPLADVPDLVWRTTRPQDEANHFADMDESGAGTFSNKTLLDLWTENPANLSVDLWNSFYDSLHKDDKRGALPFRIWQLYDEMVNYVRQGKIAEFIATGGVLSHYAGDACQPLHVSYLHHGRPDHPEENPVHSKYETSMLDRFAPDIIAGVNQTLTHTMVQSAFQHGQGAANAIVALMHDTINKLPPMDIVTAFNEANGQSRDLLQHMWEVLGDRTISCIANGCICLASIWASAWQEGNGAALDDSLLKTIEKDTLQTLYMQSNFAPSYRFTDPRFAAALQGQVLAAPAT